MVVDTNKNPPGRLGALSASVPSLSIGQVHVLSLLGFIASGLALLAPLLLPAGYAAGAAAAKGGSGWRGHWLTGFCANLIGYASVLLPLYLIVWLARAWGYGKRGGGSSSLLPVGIRLLAFGRGDRETGDQLEGKAAATGESSQPDEAAPYTLRWYLRLSACFLGLQVTYLTWGLLQERMMTIPYGSERFRDSQFLVFANRALGGLLALPLMLMPAAGGGSGGVGAAAGRAPAFDYAYSSLSNILSSWCQYEALVHVTFPTQVLAKASKIIPVMLMGRLVSRRSYRLDEYVTSGLISAGTGMFLLSSHSEPESISDNPTAPASTAVSGGLLLTGYLVFDAFTSSWQSHLFVQYRITALQMMAGSSLLSCLVTVAAQLQQDSLSSALAFAGRHPLFAGHLALLSLCSTLGQLVIFHTIDRFGPVTFTIIMTVRQAFAILISCLVYQHQLSSGAWLGVIAVFGALFLRIYFAQRLHRARS